MSNTRKKHYYVLVLTDEGAVFVTKINPENKTAEFNKTEKPLEMTKEKANNLATGLMANLNMAFAVGLFFQLKSQIYNYENGCFTWVENN